MNESFRFDIWLKEQMEKRNMNIFQLAEKAQISPQIVTYYLRRTRMPNLRTLFLILDVFHMRMVFEDVEEGG